MSLEDAKKFILESTGKNRQLNNILEKTKSKFESDEAKFEYIASKAKELGYYFTSKEFSDAFSNSKKELTEDQLEKITGGIYSKESSGDIVDKAKNFWKSLW